MLNKRGKIVSKKLEFEFIDKKTRSPVGAIIYETGEILIVIAEKRILSSINKTIIDYISNCFKTI